MAPLSNENRARLFADLTRSVRLFIAGASLFSQRVADKLNMHPTDLQFLNLLELLGPLTPGTLAQCSGLTTGGVTVVLDRLEKSGYIRRLPNPADRRSVLVDWIPAKRKKVTSNYDAVEGQFHMILGEFSEEELQTVLTFFSTANAARSREKSSAGKQSRTRTGIGRPQA
ncbi:MarR family winged helix-turn-helix transcriptional regulator [Paracidobacterium acidisoli]|uniref:MarR family transcriptional regulator n=1 Tax=Paracidobacterium acidisoli TaxID=2303751 RepID=A0A372ITX8_9BACT|nr:MarR family transcriptional regulator [Paracidobacterium acidisoli]MBT9329813.1 MarR family transcriptional regulator [Paracidobacterium acidisoli]